MNEKEMNEIRDTLMRNVAGHEMTILKEDGVYRHIRFKNPGSCNYYFDLLTWPGGLLFRGDIGCYEFERVEDMFSFFHDKKESGSISPMYWSEKCRAESRSGDGIWEFKSDPVRDMIYSAWEEYFDGEDGTDCREAQEIKEIIDEDLQYVDKDSEWQWVSAVYNMDFSNVKTESGSETRFSSWNQFMDGFSYAANQFTFQFIICLHAIVWGINKYYKEKENE